jgi:cell division protease FtsH
LSDLEKITKQARAMITVYGLNESIGNITYYDSSGQSEYGFTKPYSEETAQKIDKEISVLIETQYQRAISILEENKDKLTTLAKRLLEKEVIFKDDLEKIFGKRPFSKDIEEEALAVKAREAKAEAEEVKAEEAEAEEDKTNAPAPEDNTILDKTESQEPIENKK